MKYVQIIHNTSKIPLWMKVDQIRSFHRKPNTNLATVRLIDGKDYVYQSIVSFDEFLAQMNDEKHANSTVEEAYNNYLIIKKLAENS